MEKEMSDSIKNSNSYLTDKNGNTGKILFSTQSNNEKCKGIASIPNGNGETDGFEFGNGISFCLKTTNEETKPRYVSKTLENAIGIIHQQAAAKEEEDMDCQPGPSLKSQPKATISSQTGMNFTRDHNNEKTVNNLGAVNEDISNHVTEGNMDNDGGKGTRLPAIFYIKTYADKIKPVDQTHMFTKDQIQDRELIEQCETVFQKYVSLMESIPTLSRQEHFVKVDEWQAVPEFMSLDYETNLVNVDAARFFETFLMTSDILFPAAIKSSSCDIKYNVLYLCPPSGGAVVGTKLFLDLNYSHLNVNWMACTRHPWKESNDLKLVVPEDAALLLEPSKWKFVINDEMNIQTAETVRDLVWEVRTTSDTETVDMVVADMSPSLVDIDSCTSGLQLVQQIKTALITESGQIEIALRTLNKGGNFILSVVNPLDQFSTIGNLQLLCELFSTVSVIFTHPSSTCFRSAVIACSGYVGGEKFRQHFPDFTTTYLRLVVENINSGNKVLLDTVDMDPIILTRIVEMARAWVAEESPRLQSLVSTFNNLFMEPPHHHWRQNQLGVAARWMHLVNGYVSSTVSKWNLNIATPRTCSAKDLKELISLYQTEVQILERNDASIDNIIKRLKRAYIDTDVVTLQGPDKLNVEFYKLQFNIQKYTAVVKEPIPNLISYSRFMSLQRTYDFAMARQAGAKFPVTNYAVRIKSGIQQTCTSHFKVKLMHTLNREGFSFNVQEKRLAVTCLNFSTSARLKMSDGMFHQRVIGNLLERLSDIKLLDRYDNMFACMLPLTSRLLLGIVCILNKCFEKTSLVVCKTDRVMGILFQRFRGHKHNDVLWTKTILSSLVCDLENKKNVDMELVPLPSLLKCIDLNSLFEYNNAVVGRTIATTVNVLLSALKKSHDVGFLFNH